MISRYTIVWFEDSPTYIKSARQIIENYIVAQGFKPDFIIRSNGKDLDKLILDEKEGDEKIDLILMDHNLSTKNENGKKLIDKIRENELFTEIIFYSGQPNFQEAIVPGLEGVFFSNKKDLHLKTKKLIDLTIKKKEDINSMRGLVIAEAIEIENLMEHFFLSYFKLNPDQTEILRAIFNPKTSPITAKLKYDYINSLLNKEIEKISIEINKPLVGGVRGTKKDLIKKRDDLQAMKEIFLKIEDEVIDIRNTFAHVIESPDEKNTLINNRNSKKTVIKINTPECKKIRNNIRKHSANIEQLMGKIC